MRGTVRVVQFVLQTSFEALGIGLLGVSSYLGSCLRGFNSFLAQHPTVVTMALLRTGFAKPQAKTCGLNRYS